MQLKHEFRSSPSLIVSVYSLSFITYVCLNDRVYVHVKLSCREIYRMCTAAASPEAFVCAALHALNKTFISHVLHTTSLSLSFTFIKSWRSAPLHNKMRKMHLSAAARPPPCVSLLSLSHSWDIIKLLHSTECSLLVAYIQKCPSRLVSRSARASCLRRGEPFNIII
jgi:hypothetical protein